ncbi:ATP-binding protein [Jannaschia sp. LMIT008]|uniref:ATP-binding protein n=1 Tax=Jannaschia maritima TaxID=3032585 RepID=UPI002810F1BD|nr:ATP-binding protein [Jannaschia sp. LMIT008]
MTLGGRVLFRDRFAGTEAGVSGALSRAQADLGASPLGVERRDNLVIVLGEVLNNSVEHGMADRTDGWIEMIIRMNPADRAEVAIADDGRPLPLHLLQGAQAPDVTVDADAMPEGGFGWFIIHTLVDDMTYERADGRNHLTFSI